MSYQSKYSKFTHTNIFINSRYVIKHNQHVLFTIKKKKLFFKRSINVRSQQSTFFIINRWLSQVISLEYTELTRRVHKFCLSTNIAESPPTAARYILINQSNDIIPLHDIPISRFKHDRSSSSLLDDHFNACMQFIQIFDTRTRLVTIKLA